MKGKFTKNYGSRRAAGRSHYPYGGVGTDNVQSYTKS